LEFGYGTSGRFNLTFPLWCYFFYVSVTLKEKFMAKVSTFFPKDFEKCVAFHGHLCPGIAVGFRAARVLMERLGVRRAGDEELVAIIETDACGADAIQVMTGCTFGKGNFIFKNYGKHAFTLADRKRGRAVRVCLRPGALEADPGHLFLFERVQNDEASPEEISRFRELQRKRVQKVLEADIGFLFKIEEILPDIPPKSSVKESGTCDLCGELTKIDLLRETDGQRACIPCARDKSKLRR
jgi:formylmethanofuran dehydrogenase subunit E